MGCVLLALPAQALSVEAAPRLLVWGDSLSAGYGLNSNEAWPKLLQDRLKEEGYIYHVINGSVSGETSDGGRSRLPAALAEHKPRVLVLALGANDGLRGLAPARLTENLVAMIEEAQATQARVLLVGMQMPPNYGRSYTAAFAQAFKDAAEQTGVAFVPFLLDGFADQPEAFQADGNHPTAASQPLLLDNVWPTLKTLLDQPASH